MEKFKVSTNVTKIGENNQILIKDIVNEVTEFDRNFGIDGQDFRIKDSDGEKSIDLSSYAGIKFIRLSAVWDETDETVSVVKGEPAPFEFQVNGGSNPWSKQSVATFESPQGLTSLKIKNPDSVNSKYIKVKLILSASGMA